MALTLNAQNYNSYAISTYLGTGYHQERGLVFSYDLEIKKHIGLGIYGILSHGVLNAQKTINTLTFPSNNDRQLIDQSQLNFWGIGIAKSLAVSNKGRLNLALIGQTIQLNRFKLTNLQFNQGILDVENSTDTYSTRNNFGFSVTIDYQYNLTNQINIGLFSRYQSTINSILFGLKANSGFNFKSNKNSTSETNTTTNNLLELRVGYGAGDGGNNRWMYDLAYGYKVKNKITLLAKFTVAQGKRRLSDLLGNRKELIFESVHIAANNESEDPALETILFHAIGLGAKFKINKMEKSSISIYTGINYFFSNQINIQGLVTVESEFIDVKENYTYENKFTPELALHYDYQLNKHLYLGASINYLTVPVLFSGGIHLGTNF